MPSYVTLADAGRLVVWGQDTSSERKDVPKAADFHRILPGGRIQSLAVHYDGTLALFGGKDPATGNKLSGTVPDLTALKGVKCHDAALGLEHVVGILEDDRTIVMDSPFYSPGPASPGVPSQLPVLAPPGQFERVATAAAHGIALRLNGTLAHWGSGSTMGTPVPQGRFIKVRARGDYSLALRADGVLFGWGGSFDALPDPLWSDWKNDGLGHWYVEGPFKDMDAGIVQKDFMRGGKKISMPHVVAVHEGSGRAEGWGANSNGETDAPPAKFQAVAAGRGVTIGLDEDGFLYQWGRSWDRVQISTTAPAPPGPAPLPAPLPRGKFISISAGGDHAVAVRRGGAVVIAGPDFVDLIHRQPRMEHLASDIASIELTSALQVVRQAIAEWRHTTAASPDDQIQREQQLRDFDRLAEQLQIGEGVV